MISTRFIPSVLSVCVTTLSLTILSNAGQPHLYTMGARA